MDPGGRHEAAVGDAPEGHAVRAGPGRIAEHGQGVGRVVGDVEVLAGREHVRVSRGQGAADVVAVKLHAANCN